MVRAKAPKSSTNYNPPNRGKSNHPNKSQPTRLYIADIGSNREFPPLRPLADAIGVSTLVDAHYIRADSLARSGIGSSTPVSPMLDSPFLLGSRSYRVDLLHFDVGLSLRRLSSTDVDAERVSPAGIDVALGMNPRAKFCNPNRKRKLKFIDPILINGENRVFISEAAHQRSSENWKNAIVIYVYMSRQYHIHLSAYIKWVWRPLGSFEVFARYNGFFFIKFSNGEDCERVLEGGPNLFDSGMIFVQGWKTRLKFDRDLLSSMNYTRKAISQF